MRLYKLLYLLFVHVLCFSSAIAIDDEKKVISLLKDFKSDNLELEQRVGKMNSLMSLTNILKNDSLKGVIYNTVAQFYLDQGDYLNSLSYTDKAHLIFMKNFDTLNMAFSDLNYGRVNFLQGIDFFDTAITFYSKANKAFLLEGNIEGIVNTNINISIVYFDELTKNSRSDLYNLSKADSIIDYAISVINNNDFLLAKAQHYKSKILFLKNQCHQAYNLSKKNVELFQKFNNKYYLALALKTLGEIHYCLDNFQESLNCLLKSEKLAKELNNSDLLNNIYETISSRYYEKGNYKKSMDYFKLSVDQKFQLYNKLRILNISEYERKIEIENKNKKIQLLEKDNQIKELSLNSLYSNIFFITLIIACSLIIFFIFVKLNFKRKNDSIQNKLLLSKLQALQLQMNPHFIFNTMNSIKYLVDKKSFEKASEYLVKLSKLMRMVLEKSKSYYILLIDELEMLDLYIRLELLRFDDKFKYDISVNGSLNLNAIYLPPMIIQPYIENAIYHGLNNKIGIGNLTINFDTQKNRLICKIVDNGVGRQKSSEINQNRKNHNSLGISTTKQRIQIINSAYNIDISEKIVDLYNDNLEPSGTEVEIIFPLINDGNIL